ncbi:MAG: hypothetical protein R3A48_15470 [Polyangiales bacterium]
MRPRKQVGPHTVTGMSTRGAPAVSSTCPRTSRTHTLPAGR